MTTITLRDCSLIFRPHFGGHADTYNKEGDRNFRVRLSENQAEILTREGFNVSWTKPSEKYASEPTINVHISYRFIPPTIKVHNGKKMVVYDESMLDILDGARISNCHISVNRSTLGGAYLVTGIFFLDQDELAAEFDDEEEEMPF